MKIISEYRNTIVSIVENIGKDKKLVDYTVIADFQRIKLPTEDKNISVRGMVVVDLVVQIKEIIDTKLDTIVIRKNIARPYSVNGYTFTAILKDEAVWVAIDGYCFLVLELDTILKDDNPVFSMVYDSIKLAHDMFMIDYDSDTLSAILDMIAICSADGKPAKLNNRYVRVYSFYYGYLTSYLDDGRYVVTGDNYSESGIEDIVCLWSDIEFL